MSSLCALCQPLPLSFVDADDDYDDFWPLSYILNTIVNGAVSSDEFSTSNRRGGRQNLVSSNLSGREAEQSNDHTLLLRNQYH